MRRIWVDLIREERENPERERRRWCGECALWRQAAGAATNPGRSTPPVLRKERSPDSPAPAPIAAGDVR